MSRPVNLYLLSRISGEEEFNNVYHHAAEKPGGHMTREREIRSLRILVDRLIADGVPVTDLDGFFFGYEIPQIGKEFDLLKFQKGKCLSIELKSQPVPLEQIRQQLLKNQHYLGHLGIDLSLFTVVTDPLRCYRLEDGRLEEIRLSAIEESLSLFQKDYLREIDHLFRASEYLVSPVNTPEKFIRGEYFLTQAQDQVKKDILSAIGDVKENGAKTKDAKAGGPAFYSLLGKPGTGKTLLLYDLGKTLAERGRTAILHSGAISDGHRMITEEIPGLQILEADRNIPDDTRFVLVDEAHRLTPEAFESILENARACSQYCLFCLDPEKVLSRKEKTNNITGRVEALPPDAVFTLSERIHTNRQLRSFILHLRNLRYDQEEPMQYPDVSLSYAKDPEEAETILSYYRSRGYVFINYAGPAGQEDLRGIAGDAPDPHQIIGQEFDSVVMLMDGSFWYDEDGRLRGADTPEQEYNYPDLFYQGITRVREKLALVVVDNEELFSKISGIVGKSLFRN